MKWRFEYVLAILLFLGLAGALVGAFWIGNIELINIIITALIAGFSGMIAYFFTKHKPGDK